MFQSLVKKKQLGKKPAEAAAPVAPIMLQAQYSS
jgi:hypothetical protein